MGDSAEQSAAFAAAMEDILSVYAAPPDPARPLICFDEGGKQLQRQVRPPVPARPGQPAREDYTYERNGAANLFLACAPIWAGGRCWCNQRSARPSTSPRPLRWLVDEALSRRRADRAWSPTTSIPTPRPRFYQAFPPTEARRIAGASWSGSAASH